jgi:tetratricopeptide (TPR) repeat protein
MQSRRIQLLSYVYVPLILATITVVVYSNSFTCSWQLDDFRSIVQYDYEHATPLSLFRFSPQRSLGFHTFWLNYLVADYWLPAWHAVNLALHIANVILVLVLARWLFLSVPQRTESPHREPFALGTAAAVAALFAVHPVQTQAVTYIVQRLELLGALFLLLGVRGLAGVVISRGWRARTGWLAIGMLAMVLGGLTKETIVAAPCLAGAFLVLVYFRTWRSRLTALAVFGGMALGLVCAALVMFKALKFTPWPALTLAPFATLWKDAPPLSQYYPTQVRVLALMLRLCLFPFGQRVEYVLNPSTSWFDPRVLVTGALQLGLIGVAAALWRRRPMILFGVAWFYIVMLPSSILPNGVFEHRVYAALPGVLFAVLIPLGEELLDQPARLRSGLARAALGLVLCLVLTFCVLTYIRNGVWQTELTLWADTVKKSPQSWRANANYGFALLNEGDVDQARTYLERSFELNSNAYLVANNLGIFYAQVGERDRSIEMFKYALRLKPGNVMVLGNLGGLYLQTGNIVAGTNLLARSGTDEALVTLGQFHAEIGEYERAYEAFAMVVGRKSRDVDAWVGAADMLLALGRTNEARAVANEGLRCVTDAAALTRLHRLSEEK